MIVRWWRRSRAPWEEWHLLALKPDGVWASLAIVKARYSDSRKRDWYMSACVTMLNGGWTSMGSNVSLDCSRRCVGMRAAERLYGISKPVRHARWSLAMRGGWDYPPPVEGHAEIRAKRLKSIKPLKVSFAELVTAIAVAYKAAESQAAKAEIERVYDDLGRGDLVHARKRLRDAWRDAPTLNAIDAYYAAMDALAAFDVARKEVQR
jgi:hypothetical protein